MTTKTTNIIAPRTTSRSFVTNLLALLTLVLALSLGKPAHAQISVLLQPADLTGTYGDVLSYNATLTNLSTTEVFLNGDSFSLSGTGLTLDDSPFFTNFPLSLLGGESVTAELFTVTIDPSATIGTYTGTFTIQGGATDNDFNDLAPQGFSASVAPEPASFSLLAVGAMGAVTLAGVKRRRRQDKTAQAL